MDELPVEIIVRFFQYLSKKEQITISKVNKKFREALFSPTLWTETEERMEVPASQLESFKKFLKQAPWLKYLNLLVSESEKNLVKHYTINDHTLIFPSVFKYLNNLECLSLQLQRCIIPCYPCTLKHVSLEDCRLHDVENFITDNILMSIADHCPHLEHIQIKSHINPAWYTFAGLSYLLKKVKKTLQTFILSDPYGEYPVFKFNVCPPNLVTLCLVLYFDFYIDYEYEHELKLPNLEKLQFLCIGDHFDREDHPEEQVSSTILANCSLKSLRFLYLIHRFPFEDEAFYSKFAKLPNLQFLYLDKCEVDIDVMVRFVKDCSSLKVLAWMELSGYSKKELFELEKLKKETSVKIYLSFTGYSPSVYKVTYFPSFPNEYFDCIKTFNRLFDGIYFWENFFHCHAPILKILNSF